MVQPLKGNHVLAPALVFVALLILGIHRRFRRLLMPVAGLYLLATERPALLLLLCFIPKTKPPSRHWALRGFLLCDLGP